LYARKSNILKGRSYLYRGTDIREVDQVKAIVGDVSEFDLTSDNPWGDPLHYAICRLMESDEDWKDARNLRDFYKEADSSEKAIIDSALLMLCGFRLCTILDAYPLDQCD